MRDKSAPIIEFTDDGPPEEQNRPKGSITFWSKQEEVTQKVYAKVIIDHQNLPLQYDLRQQVARTLREIADEIEHRKPVRDFKENTIWKRDTDGRVIGWYQYEDA